MFSAKIFLLTLSYVASLLTFQAGILTRRRVLTSRGSCAGSNTSYCLESSSPEYGQVVLLIIDALRHKSRNNAVNLNNFLDMILLNQLKNCLKVTTGGRCPMLPVCCVTHLKLLGCSLLLLTIPQRPSSESKLLSRLVPNCTTLRTKGIFREQFQPSLRPAITLVETRFPRTI
jgi:hypothetical protein